MTCPLTGSYRLRHSGGWRCLSSVMLCAVLGTMLTGCDFLALTDEQFVKNKIREHAAAVTARDWKAAATFYDQRVQWQHGTAKLEGRDAAKGFLISLNEMSQMDEFHTIVRETRRVNPELIEAKVTMQAHLVLSSAQLDFSNRFWDARMGWVKRGPGNWKIAYIIETTVRQEGKFSRI